MKQVNGLKVLERNDFERQCPEDRGVQSIDKDVKLNQALWAMTEQMAEIKKAA